MRAWKSIRARSWEAVVCRIMGQVWDEDMAVGDLDYWAEVGDRPGIRVLAERWGWRSNHGKPSEKRVRLLIAEYDEVEGHDRGTDRARQRHAEGTPRARAGHAEGTDGAQKQADNQGPGAREGHAEGTDRAREGHAEGTGRAREGLTSCARDLRAGSTPVPDPASDPSLSDTAPAAPRETGAPAPTRPAAAPRGLGRRATSGGWSQAANAATEAVGGLAPSPAAPPGTAGPQPDPLAQVWAHAAQYGPLPAWSRTLLPAALRDHDPAVLCRVLDWARRAPDPDAAAIRHAIDSRARGALGPAYILDHRWLGDRLVRAETWDLDGRPEAEGAHVPEPELLARRQAEEAEARAEDAARWPDWEPPPGWEGLARDYRDLCGEAQRARELAEVGGDSTTAGAAWLRRVEAQGWREDWPGPASKADHGGRAKGTPRPGHGDKDTIKVERGES